jgi:hypothetical protein
MTLESTLLDYIRKYPGASYPNLQSAAEQAGFDTRGDIVLAHGDFPTLIFWGGMSAAFAGAILSLLQSGLVKERPTCLLVYLVDGGLLKHPVATTIKAYKEPHWLPTVFDPIKAA